MRKLLIKYKAQLRNLILYIGIGICGASLDFGIFTTLNLAFDVHYQVANCLGITAGILLSFTLNSRYNFKKTDYLFKRFLSFFLVGLCGMAISAGVLQVFIETQAIHHFATQQLHQLGMTSSLDDADSIYILLVKLFSIGLVTVVQFTLNKFISFRELD